jgi:hypothetical protein
MSEFDMGLVYGNEDIVVILKNYCEKCAHDKLNIIKTFPIDKQNATDLIKKYGVRPCRIKCECVQK